ncbi:hypothetical protein LR48_Vigan11g096400 [Vigna angularis]|uniref:Uncharacterized protein n=1 Tax=Phaseolus angularis TaxID=3914 RepID=A0A0L9VS77_PHAAN|nr:hypothetical protein LR48_Vigan11g096400 [Vigna angularis]
MGAVGGDIRSSSSVSSSFLEKSDEREVDSGPESPFYGGERGESSSKARDPRTTSSSRASASIKIRQVVPLTDQVTVAIAQPTTVVDLEPSTGTTPSVVAAPSTEKKRKSKEGEKSSSKRNCREGSSSHSIPVGVFDPKFHVSSRRNFHMSSSQCVIVEPMSEGHLINAAMELTARGAMLSWCVRELANRRGARNLQTELDKEKKTSDALQTRVEALAIDHTGCAERRAGLQTKLDDARAELTKTSYQLKAAGAKADQSVEEVGKLRIKVKRLRWREEELEGFNKALRQAAFLLKVDPLAFGFDINQDVFSGKMLLIDEADDEDTGVDEPAHVDNAAPEDPFVEDQAGKTSRWAAGWGGLLELVVHRSAKLTTVSFWNSVHQLGLSYRAAGIEM